MDWARSQVAKHKRPLLVLSPFSAYVNRQWPLSRWLHLEDRLRTDEYGLIVLDGPGDGQRLKPFLSSYFWGLSPGEVAALVSSVDGVIANDSGLAHLGGTLHVPTVALCGPTSGQRVFSWYRSVATIQAPFNCSPCYWKPERGYHRACDTQCDALAQVTVDEVATRIAAMVRDRGTPRTARIACLPDDESMTPVESTS